MTEKKKIWNWIFEEGFEFELDLYFVKFAVPWLPASATPARTPRQAHTGPVGPSLISYMFGFNNGWGHSLQA